MRRQIGDLWRWIGRSLSLSLRTRSPPPHHLRNNWATATTTPYPNPERYLMAVKKASRARREHARREIFVGTVGTTFERLGYYYHFITKPSAQNVCLFDVKEMHFC